MSIDHHDRFQQQHISPAFTPTQNIASHPGEEKYLKVRSNNRALRERVFEQRGAREFLVGAGFESTSLPVEEGDAEEEFLIMNQE